MPAFLVQIPSNKRVQDVDTLVVFAANEAGARSAAAGRFSGDANALWNTLATVTEIVAGTELADAGGNWSAYCRVSGAAAQTPSFDPFIVEVDGKSRNQAEGRLGAVRKHLNGALNDGGTATYEVDDILTAAGGTFTRAATFRVTTVNTGVITGLELVDPGEYSVLPDTMTANPVTGGGGTDALVDLTEFAENSYEAILAQMVTGLLGSPDIDDAELDLSEAGSGARLLTVASIADGIGDATVEFEIRNNGVAFAPLVSTITDGGVAGAVLTVAIPASPIAPPRIHALKS
jgi:hypothetical protein